MPLRILGNSFPLSGKSKPNWLAYLTAGPYRDTQPQCPPLPCQIHPSLPKILTSVGPCTHFSHLEFSLIPHTSSKAQLQHHFPRGGCAPFYLHPGFSICLYQSSGSFLQSVYIYVCVCKHQCAKVLQYGKVNGLFSFLLLLKTKNKR